jgi:UDP-glucose 4-epimerase
MAILVTGGAGYIGSVLTEELVAQGHQVIVLDSLKQGHRAAVVPEATFIQVDLGDKEALEEVFRRHHIEIVMHLAADISVENSMIEPGKFFWNNVVCGINLLQCMLEHGAKKLVFSSSAAVYGEPREIPVTEASPVNPVNAYGESKAMFERILHWYGQAHGFSSISLRYFNVAGASQRFGADHHPETNLIPVLLKVALGKQDYIPLFGVDYDTKDGTCVRDYIHVLDIARAHILALKCFGENAGNQVYNLGNGEGYSVMEVIEAARRVTGAKIPVEVYPRRPGDPPELVASSEMAKAGMEWEPQYPELESIIGSAWQWQREHPQGYENR